MFQDNTHMLTVEKSKAFPIWSYKKHFEFYLIKAKISIEIVQPLHKNLAVCLCVVHRSWAKM